MSPMIYAVVNNDGYLTTLVNALLLPEIAAQANAVPAPTPDPFPEKGKVWRRVGGEWVQVPDLQMPLASTAFT